MTNDEIRMTNQSRMTNDEGAVDFQAVDGELVEAGERRAAGAEFVHQYDHVHGADFGDSATGGFGVSHDHAFGQLDRESGGVSAGFFKNFLKLGNEAGLI